MRIDPVGIFLLCGLLACGCTAMRPVTPHSAAGGAIAGVPQSTFAMEDMAKYLQRMQRRDAAVSRAEVKRLQQVPDATLEERLKLAWLYDQEGASSEELTSAQELLTGLEAAFGDPSLQVYVRLMQRTLDRELALRQARKRADELQAKIDHLKDLEQNLQERSQVKPPAKK